ncbi:DNA-binding protein [Segeticoccus rhizosphaerae]|uniref:DNA-binding protein n=1 Tax=Segeticoccus rhizosphaerae TaxID=1104777 RepID=UPI0010C03748|nr:DNA-binding protein [Ornithinicoccus soli]
MARRIITLEQVSERTGVALNTLRYYRATGKGGPKTFRLAGRVVADADDVDAWIEEAYAAADDKASA